MDNSAYYTHNNSAYIIIIYFGQFLENNNISIFLIVYVMKKDNDIIRMLIDKLNRMIYKLMD